MKKIAIIGHFGDGHICLNGQTIKTKIITQELKDTCGEEEVICFDTYGGMRNILKAPLIVWKTLAKARNVIILPAQHAIRVYVPLLVLLQFLFKDRRIHYVVIGGWLPEFLKKKRLLRICLKHIYKIYVETSTMKTKLIDVLYKNCTPQADKVVCMPNCKPLNIISTNELKKQYEEPYRLCTFSRVNRMKGIEEAVQCVYDINNKNQRIIYSLDIYGSIDSGEEHWFKNLCSNFPSYITYKGTIDYLQSVDILKTYFLLLFPTRYATEGIPGTIIDAYAAGVPVLSARWQSFADVIDEDITGIGFEQCNIDDMHKKLIEIHKYPQRIINMKEACRRKAITFQPHQCLQILVDNILSK